MTSLPTVVLATGNAGKAREFGRLLAGVFLVEPLPAGVQLAEETGATFEENALLKARAVYSALAGRRSVLADDSGLEVHALGCRPGVHSARYAGESATDEQNVTKLLAELSGVADRRACFVCCLCLLVPTDRPEGEPRLVQVRGESPGVIEPAPRGDDGFGYDPVFRPLAWTETLAEAAPERKDQISHRGAAARSLLSIVKESRLVPNGS